MELPDRKPDDPAAWKERYLASLGALEGRERAWVRVDELLRRCLARLAVAALGQNAGLDRQLDRLRLAIRNGADAEGLHELTQQVSQTASRIQDAQARTAELSDPYLAALLDRLRLPPDLTDRAHDVRTRLGAGADDDALMRMVEQLADSLSEAACSGTQPTPASRRGLLFGLFGHPADGTDRTPEAGRRAPEQPRLNEVLLDLLDRLDFPSTMASRLHSLKERLTASVAVADIPSVLREVASLVTDTRLSVEREKREIEAFLQEVTERLRTFDDSLRDADSARAESLESGRSLHDTVGENVARMRTSVHDAHDIRQLKASLQKRLDAVQAHMEGYMRDEEQRNQEAEQRIRELGQRVLAMEAETGELRVRMQEAHAQAVRDPLTDLFNRFAFDEHIEQEYARWKRYQNPLSLLILDVDRFKTLNDAYGHTAGDKALKALAARMRASVRETDFITRYGGEEFVILMPNTQAGEALTVAEKLRQVVGECEFHHQSTPVRVTVSCGVAQFQAGDTPVSVFERADEALYRAKRDGRNLCRLEIAPSAA